MDLIVRYITNQRELRKNMQAVVEQQWKEVGIGAELVNYSSDIFWNGYNDGGPQAQGEYDIAEYSSVQNAYPDPDTDALHVRSNCQRGQPGWRQLTRDTAIRSWMNCSSSRPSTLIRRSARSCATRSNRSCTMMYIYIGMWKDPDLWSVSSRLKNVKFSGVYPFWNAYEWEVIRVI